MLAHPPKRCRAKKKTETSNFNSFTIHDNVVIDDEADEIDEKLDCYPSELASDCSKEWS